MSFPASEEVSSSRALRERYESLLLPPLAVLRRSDGDWEWMLGSDEPEKMGVLDPPPIDGVRLSLPGGGLVGTTDIETRLLLAEEADNMEEASVCLRFSGLYLAGSPDAFLCRSS